MMGGGNDDDDDGRHNSMLVGVNARGHIHLIVGTNPLASARCTQSLAAGAKPILVAPPTSTLHYALQSRIDDGLVTWRQEAFEDSHLFTLGRAEIGSVVDAVFVTSSASSLSTHVADLCRRNRIPVNVVDAPHLCTFSLLSTHTDGPLQVGVTTNGRGCKLASRIRREIAASLPRDLGGACARLGQVRRRIQHDDLPTLGPTDADDSVDQDALFNKLVVVVAGPAEQDADVARNRRMRWLGQMCEYWPLSRLASVTDADVDKLLTAYSGLVNPPLSSSPSSAAPNFLGKVFLAGSGPGHPDLLTTATLKAIQTADVILADKLVPSAVLALIPRRTPVHIARKFPGNADLAQQELLEAALQAVRAGKTVLRLKQGDPFIYGRGGEEVAFFAERGMARLVTVLPGLTSALTAPLLAGIPPTQRDVADQVLVCTGTGKKGKPPDPPPYVASRTVIFLMALHRIADLVAELVDFPDCTPCAVVERASCPDQRVIRSTLRHVVAAVEAEGSRPPGLLVVGRACEVLFTPERGRAWVVEDGFRGLDMDVQSDKSLSDLAATWEGAKK